MNLSLLRKVKYYSQMGTYGTLMFASRRTGGASLLCFAYTTNQARPLIGAMDPGQAAVQIEQSGVDFEPETNRKKGWRVLESVTRDDYCRRKYIAVRCSQQFYCYHPRGTGTSKAEQYCWSTTRANIATKGGWVCNINIGAIYCCYEYTLGGAEKSGKIVLEQPSFPSNRQSAV